MKCYENAKQKEEALYHSNCYRYNRIENIEQYLYAFYAILSFTYSEHISIV